MTRTLLAILLAFTVSSCGAAELQPAPVADSTGADLDALRAEQARIAAEIEAAEERKRNPPVPPGAISIQVPPAELATHGLHWLEVTGLDDHEVFAGAQLRFLPRGFEAFLQYRPGQAARIGIHAERPGERLVVLVATIDGKAAIASAEIVVGGDGDHDDDGDEDEDDDEPPPPPEDIGLVVIVRESSERDYEQQQVEMGLRQYSVQSDLPLKIWDDDGVITDGSPHPLIVLIVAAARKAGVEQPVIAACAADGSEVVEVVALPDDLGEAIGIIKNWEVTHER